MLGFITRISKIRISYLIIYSVIVQFIQCFNQFCIFILRKKEPTVFLAPLKTGKHFSRFRLVLMWRLRSVFVRSLQFVSISKKFTNYRTLITLYNTLVRPNLEYCFPMRSPFYSVYNDQIERVQRKFTRVLIYRLSIPYESYDDRFHSFEMMSLLARSKMK